MIDGSTRRVTATVPVGNQPSGVAVDPDSRTVYVTNGDPHDGMVSVIESRYSSQIETVFGTSGRTITAF